MKAIGAGLIAAVVLAAGIADAFAQGSGGGKGKRREARAPYSYFEAKGLFPTGLEAAFPAGATCPGIASPYGSRTRYDGSPRNNPHHGYHNGLDISLAVGTPLLAIADGTVVHKGTAGRLVGSFVWLHVAPADSGLPVHVFARYQHLDRPSPVAVGDRVSAGQEIGVSGNTGTTGGHFGAQGYPHLHIALYIGDGPEFTVKGPMLGPKSLNYLDPLGFYVPRPVDVLDNQRLRDLPDEKKTVLVPVRTTDGITVPAGSPVVWPVACAAE